MAKKLSFIDGLREYRDTLRVLDILYIMGIKKGGVGTAGFHIEKKNPIRPEVDNYEN